MQFSDQHNDPNHLALPLEKNKIAKLKNGNASVKTVAQPYASFGGKQSETSPAYYTRGSERLRHKNRSITAWDYERMVLEAFPEVQKVKCIPHAKFIPGLNRYCWLAPGNVVLVVVPNLANKNAVDPLSPKVNGDTISRITEFINNHCGMQVKVKVKNPAYQKMQLDLKVKFHEGYEFNFYSEKLKEQIRQYLSPWAYSTGKDITFGGTLQMVLLTVEVIMLIGRRLLPHSILNYGKSNDRMRFNSNADTTWFLDQTHVIREIKIKPC